MKKIICAIFLIFLSTSNALACACGCGMMNVGTSSLIPACQGGVAFLQYDNMRQTRNWRGNSQSSAHNHDKRIETQTYTAGAQYMFNRKWGVSARLPVVTRYKKEFDHHAGDLYARHSDIGDIKLSGIYSGFFDDMSTGITFGLKLPTGQTNSKGFARNEQIGTGSTDLLLGAYHLGSFGASNFGYFLQASAEEPMVRHRGFTPGYEISAAAGSYYNAGQFGSLSKVAPMLQIIATKKGKNSGWNGHHMEDSGYNLVYFAPGLELDYREFKVYFDVEFPLYRYVNGTQLAPQNIYKIILGYNF